jgi:ElaB/YqjD/DUF883 family membrane-anchored ribosome-binding protein
MADETMTGTTGNLDDGFAPATSPALGAMTTTTTTPPVSDGTTEKVAAAAKTLGTQATDQIRGLADTGKARASGALGEFARMLDDAAGQVDERLGEQFGGYARQAAGSVRSVADGLDGKELDDIVEDVRAFVQKSPALAIGTAAALGFVVARVLRSGIDANRA